MNLSNHAPLAVPCLPPAKNGFGTPAGIAFLGGAWIPAILATFSLDLSDPNLARGLMVLAGVEAVIIFKLWLGRSKLRKEIQAQANGEDGPGNLAALYSKALTGSLDRHSIGEVLQFLNSIRETGILDILDERVSSVHRLLLEEGDIIDAYDGQHRGEDAIRIILACKEGTFTFIRGDLPSNERVIQKPTMTLLMEALQHQDESRNPKPE